MNNINLKKNIFIDTSYLSINELLDIMLQEIAKKIDINKYIKEIEGVLEEHE